jgi:hypothetical protein
MVQNGSKTLTYRLGWAVNDVPAELRVRDDRGCIRVISVHSTAFADLPRHEAYPDRDRMREVFAGYYGRVPADDDEVLVVEFRYVTLPASALR